MLISFSINFKQFFFSYFTPFFTISHLFSHLFQLFFCHCTTTHSYQSIKKKSKSIPITVLKFCLVQVCDIIRTHARTDAQTNFWITIPRVGLKALELKIRTIYLCWKIMNFFVKKTEKIDFPEGFYHSECQLLNFYHCSLFIRNL